MFDAVWSGAEARKKKSRNIELAKGSHIVEELRWKRGKLELWIVRLRPTPS